MPIEKAAVIGAGVMGSGIAAQIANAGIPVLLLDIPSTNGGSRSALAEGAIKRMLKTEPAPFMHKRAARLVTPGNTEDDLAKLSEADWIIEAVLEDLEIKRALYAKVEEVRKEGEVKQQAPPDLLEEVFELNEQLEELRAAKRSGSDPRALDEQRHQLERARRTFQHKLDQVLAELTNQFAAWDALLDTRPADAAAKRTVLARMNEVLNRHSYVRNLVTNVSDELES